MVIEEISLYRKIYGLGASGLRHCVDGVDAKLRGHRRRFGEEILLLLL